MTWKIGFIFLIVPSLSAFGILSKHRIFGWMKGGSPIPSDQLLPTTAHTNKDYPIFLKFDTPFECEACQSFVYVMQAEIAERVKLAPPSKTTFGSPYGRVDIELENLMDQKNVCKLGRWNEVAEKTDIYSPQDLKIFCHDMLEEGEDLVASEFAKLKGKLDSFELIYNICFGVCDAEYFWYDKFRMEERENSTLRYQSNNELFLKANKDREEVSVTESGLQYEIVKEHTADAETIPLKNTTMAAKVVYNSTFINGVSFDYSRKWGDSVELSMGDLIPGLAEGLRLTGVGGDIILYIPPNLAWGEKGVKRAVGPNMAVIFRVQLLDVLHESKGGKKALQGPLVSQNSTAVRELKNNSEDETEEGNDEEESTEFQHPDGEKFKMTEQPETMKEEETKENDMEEETENSAPQEEADKITAERVETEEKKENSATHAADEL